MATRNSGPRETVICKKMGGHPIICKCPFCLSQHVDKHNTCIYSMIWSYTCIYMHIQYDMNIYIHIQVNIYSYIMIQTNTYRYMHIQAYTWWSVSGVNRTSTRGIVMPRGIIHPGHNYDSYICMYLYISTRICMYVYYICLYIHVWVCIYMYLYVYVCICMYLPVSGCICTYVHVLLVVGERNG